MPDLASYQAFVQKLAIHPGANIPWSVAGLTYSVLGLNGESGEAAEILKKCLRSGRTELSAVERTNLLLELGDILWYVTNTARICGASLEVLMEMNIEKLTARRAAGAIAKTD